MKKYHLHTLGQCRGRMTYIIPMLKQGMGVGKKIYLQPLRRQGKEGNAALSTWPSRIGVTYIAPTLEQDMVGEYMKPLPLGVAGYSILPIADKRNKKTHSCIFFSLSRCLQTSHPCITFRKGGDGEKNSSLKSNSLSA